MHSGVITNACGHMSYCLSGVIKDVSVESTTKTESSLGSSVALAL